MAPDLILVVAGLSAAWAVFSIVGGERQRVLQRAQCMPPTSRSATESDKNQPTKPSVAAATSAGASSK